MFEFLDHTADTAVRLTADGEEDLIRSAVDALRCIYLGEESAMELAAQRGSSGAGPVERGDLRLEAEDGEGLLIDLLSELIFLFDTRRFLCSGIEIETVCFESPASLSGELVGMTLPEDAEIQTEVKAATHHGVRIRRDGGRLTVDIVLDL